MIEAFVLALLHLIETVGYFGIFCMSMVESTFVPIGSEFTMIPAGYLVYQGKLEALPVFLCSVGGSITGSLVNYSIAYYLGRSFLIKRKKFLMMTEEKLKKIEGFFERHGKFAIFIGRLMYGVRHYISFPAGLAKMNLKTFCLSTSLADALWVTILLSLGYAAGGNEAELHKALPVIKIIILAFVISAIFIYVKKQKKLRSSS